MKLAPVVNVPTHKVHIDPANKRTDLELEKLKPSIAKHGILQPPGLRLDAGRGCYFVVWGNRRTRAAQELGLAEIPARVFDGEVSAAEIAFYRAIENEQRLSLRPSERGRTYQELMDLQRLTAKEVAEQLQVSPATVSRHLAILALPDDILTLIDEGTVPLSTGASLARVADDEIRRDILGQVREGLLSRSNVEDAVRATVNNRQGKAKPERLCCRLGEARIAVTAPALTIDCFIKVLTDLLKQARKTRDEGKDLAALAAQLR